MLTVTSEVATTSKLFVNLWKHECNRVIADRFTHQQDKDWFEKTLKQVIEEDFDADMAGLLEAEPYFVDFLRDAPEATGMKLTCIFFKITYHFQKVSFFLVCVTEQPRYQVLLRLHSGRAGVETTAGVNKPAKMLKKSRSVL